MGSLALLQSLKESILGQASVKTIYGEPISSHGKTIIPVAKITYGYGAGAGTGGMGDASARGDQSTRFVPITDRRKLSAALLVGIAFGMWMGWRRRR